MRVLLLPACLFFACSAEKTEYFRPTRKQLYELLKNPKNREIARGSHYGQVTWGRPPNESYQDHMFCPPINKPKGASEVVCNGATCVVNCLPGYHPTPNGSDRSNCRVSRNSKGETRHYWTHQLSDCVTCSEDEFSDPQIANFCFVKEGTNERLCDLKCTNGGDLRFPALFGAPVRCFCHRKKKKGCYWTREKGKNKRVFLNQIKCSGPPPTQTTRAPENTKLSRFDSENAPSANDNGTTSSADATSCRCMEYKEKYTGGTGTQVRPTWSCPDCFQVSGGARIPAGFDKHGKVQVTFSEKVQIEKWQFPISDFVDVSSPTESKWELFFNERTTFKRDWFRIKFEGKQTKYSPQVDKLEFCTC